MQGNEHLSDDELRQIADEIESADSAGGWERSALLKDLYLDRVWRERQRDVEEGFEACAMYLGMPEVAAEHPSLMDASDGNPRTAAKYVLWLMYQAASDGRDWTMGHAARECERCFADLVHGGAPLHR